MNKDVNTFTTSDINSNIIDIIKSAIIFNSESKVEMSDDAMYIPTGNGTEVGLLKFLFDNDFHVEELYINKERNTIMETNIPFGPIRKRQVVAVRPTRDAEYVRVIVKGAPEYVIPMCTR